MICSRCKNNKEVSEFGVNKHTKSGFQSFCKLCNKECQKEFYIKNRSKVLQRKAKYRETEKYKQNSKIYETNIYSKVRKKRGKTFNTKFGAVLRDFVRRCLQFKGSEKNNKTFKLLGYDTNKLKQRLECQFKQGMTWENYGEWHIDHKKPISKFNKNSKISEINALSNLQPLWASENLSKGCKFSNI